MLIPKCQQIRYAKAAHHEYYPKHRVYLLRDLIYCAHCVEEMPEDNHNPNYGKMRPHTDKGHYLKYRCLARDSGRKCPQTSVHADVVEAQVVNVLKTLKPPANWRQRIVQAMGDLIGDAKLDERLAEIKTVIDHMDFRWDHGFTTDQQAYLNERVRLQQELERLTPIPDNELEIAADILTNFTAHWEATGGDRQKQQDLIKLIVARVWVKADRVIAISLRANYHVAIGMTNETSTDLVVDAKEEDFLHRRSRWGQTPYWRTSNAPQEGLHTSRFCPAGAGCVSKVIGDRSATRYPCAGYRLGSLIRKTYKHAGLTYLLSHSYCPFSIIKAAPFHRTERVCSSSGAEQAYNTATTGQDQPRRGKKPAQRVIHPREVLGGLLNDSFRQAA
jgi:hypothetical protein